jgi:hypothetical protein
MVQPRIHEEISDVTLRATVREGDITVSKTDEGKVHVKQIRDKAPSILDESVAVMHLSSEEFNIDVELNSQQLDALEGAIHDIQDALNQVEQ